MDKSASLTAKHLRLGYRKGKQIHEVASGVSFELHTGELTCLLGPNGVGKSTLVRTIMGILPPLGGELLIDGINIEQYSKDALSKKLSVVLTDRIQAGNLLAEDLISLGRIPHTGWTGNMGENDLRQIQDAISATKTAYLRNVPVHELSDGQLQKVMIARALAQNGEIILLDEPTAHLDLVNRHEIMFLLRQVARTSKKAILVVTHDLEIALESADKFLLMPCGQPIFSGIPEDLVIQGKVDSLLPTEALYFHKITGKIKAIKPPQQIKTSGSEELIPWVVAALEKLDISFPPQTVQLQVAADPFCIVANIYGVEHTFKSIEDLVGQLKEEVEKQKGTPES